ncbi:MULTISPECIES: hypothetical protein [Sphingomonas]|uniref:hypothetical protein n=1 Tax=Sphingomonas TaxID=13687 RepID=UPI00082BFD55|nr:hypothetical protein [Sphingomonas sp. CCH10-B3]
MTVDLGALRGFLNSNEAKSAKEATISIASLTAIERELSEARDALKRHGIDVLNRDDCEGVRQ